MSFNEQKKTTTFGFLPYLFSRNEKNLMSCLLDSFLGASDADVSIGIIRSRYCDLSSRLQFQLLQFLTIFTNYKAMVLLGDGDCS